MRCSKMRGHIDFDNVNDGFMGRIQSSKSIKYQPLRGETVSVFNEVLQFRQFIFYPSSILLLHLCLSLSTYLALTRPYLARFPLIAKSGL